MMGMFGSMPIEVQDEFNPTFFRPRQSMTDVNSFSGPEAPVLSGGGMDVTGTMKRYSHIPMGMNMRVR